MRKYRTEYIPSNKTVKADDNMSLLKLAELTDWYDDEFDQIANLLVGESLKFDDIKVTRTA